MWVPGVAEDRLNADPSRMRRIGPGPGDASGIDKSERDGDGEPAPVADITDPRWARAVAHPLRVRLLSALSERELSPVLLARELGASLPTTAYHVRRLRQLGLVELVRTRRRRGAVEHIYRARPHPRVSDAELRSLEGMPKQRLVAAVLDHLRVHAIHAAGAGGFDRPEARLAHISLELDAHAWSQLARETARLLDAAERIASQAAERIASKPEAACPARLAVLLYEPALQDRAQ